MSTGSVYAKYELPEQNPEAHLMYRPEFSLEEMEAARQLISALRQSPPCGPSRPDPD
jgi:hypothetical protein